MKKSVIYEIIDEILDEYEGGNNKVDNLRLLCPNCHSFTENFRGRKNKNGDMA